MLTKAQIKDAIEQAKVHCDLAYDDHYRTLSARGTLYELGYCCEDTNQILETLYRAGFTYCLDRDFPTKDGEYPVQEVCQWGPDQLKSRLQSIYIAETTEV